MKTVHLIRHGQSTFNAGFAETGADPMHRDARLTELGHAQVAAAKAAYAALGHELVVSSPLTRAIQTTIGLFGGGAAPILIEALHREKQTDSCDVGRSPSILAAEFPQLRFDHLADPWWHDRDPDLRGIPIEPDHAFQDRLARFRAWLAARPERTITVVGHGTFFRMLTGGRSFANCELVSWAI